MSERMNTAPKDGGPTDQETITQLRTELEQKDKALREMREALLLYHEAWNGCEGDWHAAMKAASKNAGRVLWPKEHKEIGQ